jgi:hypothetical protein
VYDDPTRYVARTATATPASELETIPLFTLSFTHYERLTTPRIPAKLRRALNIVAAYRRWLAQRTAEIALDHSALLTAFAATKSTEVWLPTF